MKFWIVLLFCFILNFTSVVELIFLVMILGLLSQSDTVIFSKSIDSFFYFFLSNSFHDYHQGSVSTTLVAWPKSVHLSICLSSIFYVIACVYIIT